MEILAFFKKNKFKKIIYIFLIIISITFVLYTNNNSNTLKKYNVIIVSIDTLSALHLPCYGYKYNTAPNLCDFANKNIIFNNSYSQSPTTLNSHFSIITSLYPQTHGMTKIGINNLSENNLTMAQLFRQNGYETIYSGVTNDPYLPMNRGFERGFNIIESVENTGTSSRIQKESKRLLENTKNGKPTFLFFHTYDVHEPHLLKYGEKNLFYSGQKIEGIPATKEENQKFTLNDYINIATNIISEKTTYDTYIKQESEKYLPTNLLILKKLQKSKTIEEANIIFNELSSAAKKYALSLKYTLKISSVIKKDPAGADYVRSLYDGEIYNFDEILKDLFKTVSDPSLSNNTILIITSDHGQEFMEHGGLLHGINLYDTSTRVPLIMKVPGVKAKRINDLVQGIDIYPTVMNLNDIKIKSLIEGIDLTGLIKGESGTKINEYVRSDFKGQLSIREGDKKYYYYSPDVRDRYDKNLPPIKNGNDYISKKAYDLSVDPGEKINILKTNINYMNKLIKSLNF